MTNLFRGGVLASLLALIPVTAHAQVVLPPTPLATHADVELVKQQITALLAEIAALKARVAALEKQPAPEPEPEPEPEPPPPLPPPSGKAVLSPSDFSYLGAFLMPHGGGWGSLAGENGQLYILTTTADDGGKLYRFTPPLPTVIAGPAPEATVQSWPCWNDNELKCVSWDYGTGEERSYHTVPNPWPTLGLAVHQGKLYVSYLDYYNTMFGGTDHCVVKVDLGQSGNARTSGSYRFDRGVKPICGNLFVTPHGLGMTGSMMALSRNHDNTWGPSLVITSWSEFSRHNGGYQSARLVTSERLMHSINVRASRNPDYRPDLDNPFNPDGPMPPPGFWTQRDRMSSAVWIDLPTKHGVVFFGGFGTGQIWYGSWDAGPHGEINECRSADRGENADSFRPEWRIYNPDQLTGGSVAEVHRFSPYSLTGGSNSYHACEQYTTGAYFDPATSRLYQASGGVINVWQVK